MRLSSQSGYAVLGKRKRKNLILTYAQKIILLIKLKNQRKFIIFKV